MLATLIVPVGAAGLHLDGIEVVALRLGFQPVGLVDGKHIHDTLHVDITVGAFNDGDITGIRGSSVPAVEQVVDQSVDGHDGMLVGFSFWLFDNSLRQFLGLQGRLHHTSGPHVLLTRFSLRRTGHLSLDAQLFHSVED